MCPLLASVAGFIDAGAALAQTPAVQSVAQPSQTAETEDEEVEGKAIIVRGKRWGRAEIDAEAEIDDTEIDSFGANTIGELVGAIAPLVDRSGDAPELLVNGKRIFNPGEIEDYPKEALARISILPDEAAAIYGFEQDKRVINLELKRRFATWNVDSGVEAPTAGGKWSTKLSFGRFTIDHDTRWSIGATLSDETELLRSERSLPLQAGAGSLLYSLGELGDVVDPNDYESLLPSADSRGVNANVTHPLGSFSGTLNFAASRSTSVQKIGLPVAVVTIPDNHPFAGNTTGVTRYGVLVSREALKNRQSSESLSTGASLSGPIEGWQANIGLRYSVNWAKTAREVGYDTSVLQQIVDDGAVPSSSDLEPANLPLRTDRLRSKTEIYGLSLSASNSIAILPAGQARASLSLNANRFRTRFSYFDAAAYRWTASDTTSDQFDGQLSVSLPVSSAEADFLMPVGELTVSATGAFRKTSGAPTSYRLGGAFNWAPISFVNLRMAYSRENAEPTYDQLYGPRIEILNRIFDFARGEHVRPLFRFGGNAHLEGGHLQTFSADLSATPFGQNYITLDLGYRQTIVEGGVTSFPTLTPEVEAAFPERVSRNQAGQLVAIDARPINIVSEETRRLTSGLSLRWTEERDAVEGADAGTAFTPWTISGSLTHQWRLQSETQIRPGLDIIDRLEGSGQARHSVGFQLNVGRKSLGANLSGTWTGPASVSGEMGIAYRYPPSTTVAFGAFVEPGSFLRRGGSVKWLDALKLSFDVQNLFNSRRFIESSTDMEGFTRDELDPLGRTIRFAVSTKF